ncbi:MAG: thioredoxin [Deltaproteobacteria bacterium]|nr:thioredoxin [Deltaproteobacteria bacterium]
MEEKKPVAILDADFEAMVLKGNGIRVVDFWAPWCGPCHSMAPALEAFSEANADKVHVFKLDVDDNPKTAEKYEIRSVPTVIFFKDGESIDTTMGAMSQAALQEKLDNLTG